GGRRCRSHTRCAAGPAPWRMGSRSAPTSFRRRRRGAKPGAARRRAWQSSPDRGGERELPAKKRARGAVVNGDAREVKPAAPAVAGDVHREAAWIRESLDRRCGEIGQQTREVERKCVLDDTNQCPNRLLTDVAQSIPPETPSFAEIARGQEEIARNPCFFKMGTASSRFDR